MFLSDQLSQHIPDQCLQNIKTFTLGHSKQQFAKTINTFSFARPACFCTDFAINAPLLSAIFNHFFITDCLYFDTPPICNRIWLQLFDVTRQIPNACCCRAELRRVTGESDTSAPLMASRVNYIQRIPTLRQ